METGPQAPDEQSVSGPLDDRADLYRTSGDLVAAIARHHTGLTVDDATHERWRQIMGLMREVDTWADDTAATNSEVLAGLQDFSRFDGRYPELAPGKLDDDSRNALLRHTARILKLGRYASQVTDPRRFSLLRAAEGRRSVELLAIVATDSVTEQPDFQTKFLPLIKSLGEAATLWDSAVDAYDDKRSGKQVAPPGPRLYGRLLFDMAVRGKPGGRALMHTNVLKHILIKGALRVSNRLRNGVPEYSNLRLLGFRHRRSRSGDPKL